MSIRETLARWLMGKPKAAEARPAAVTDYNGYRSTRFAGQKFAGGLPNPAPTLILDHEQIRQNVRTLSHQSLQLRALIRSDTDTVIGQGLNLSPEPKHRILNLDPEAAKDWITDVKTRFELWAMSGQASRNGRYNFFEAQRLMRKSLYRDGELFVALSYHNDPALISPLRFTILDPDQIRENGLTWTATGGAPWTRNKDGIIRNAGGEETAYKVWKTGPSGIAEMTEIPRTGRGGRIMMLHALTDQDYAGQLRGISPLAVCVQDLEHILDFTLSQVNKAIHQGNVTFTVESESDEAAQNPFTYLPRIGEPPGSGPAAGAFGNNPAPPPGAENVTPESVEPVYAPVSHTEINTPGSIGVYSLKGKQKLKPFPSTAPSDAFNVFVDAYFSYIAASTGWSIETVIKKFSNNYSASRATLILTWRVAEQLRWELDYYVLGPVYEMWLAEEVAAGRISAPGWADPRLRAAWTAHRYNGLSQPNIDPAKTAAAAKEYLSMGATTLEDVAIEYNDSDAESNRVKLKQELADLREVGPMPWGTGGGNNPPVGGVDEQADEDSEAKGDGNGKHSDSAD